MPTTKPATADAVRNRRIVRTRPLIPPSTLLGELPLDDAARAVVLRGRQAATECIDGDDQRLLVVVGPCSIHDPDAGLEYAHRLAALASSVESELCIVMRVYFEKPRTTVGWKGLINDPGMDGSYRVVDGLRAARRLLLEILGLGLPVGCEFLDPITPQYLADAVSWGSIGARTAQSQIHRQLCSGLSMPIGIKNSVDGDVQAAVDAVSAAGSPHVFQGIGDDGQAAIFETTGNPDCHVVLRGGVAGPNYDAASVAGACDRLAGAGLPARVIVDASHGNSAKDYDRQRDVVRDLAARIAAGERRVVGVMLESFLVAGRQDVEIGRANALTYGQSVTDACLGWDSTAEAINELAAAVRLGRER